MFVPHVKRLLTVTTLGVCAACLSLAGCGQKGPLYLPDSKLPKRSAALKSDYIFYQQKPVDSKKDKVADASSPAETTVPADQTGDQSAVQSPNTVEGSGS